MEELTSANKLILKRERGNPPIWICLIGLLGLLFYSVMEVGMIWLDFHPELKLQLISWPISLTLFYITIYLGVLLLPGQGDLILSPEGFKISCLNKTFRREYRWSEVIGFYRETNPQNQWQRAMVYFDKAGWLTNQRREVLPFHYLKTTDELVFLLNEWKGKYSPNPEGITLNPVPEKLVKSPLTWKVVFITYLPIIVMMLLIFFCSYLLRR
jgi:hypothetical protein